MGLAHRVADPLHAYQVSKRGNSLCVMAEAVRWGKRGARAKTISPGITDAVVIIGVGDIGLAIARRQVFGNAVLLADIDDGTLADATETSSDISIDEGAIAAMRAGQNRLYV